MPKKIDRAEFIDKIRFEFGAIREITRPQILEVCDKYGLDRPNWILNDVTRRVAPAGSVVASILFLKTVRP